MKVLTKINSNKNNDSRPSQKEKESMESMPKTKNFEYNEKQNESLSSQKPGAFGTRHLQVLVMSVSLMIGAAINQSLPMTIVAMTDSKAGNSDFKYYEWSTSETSLILSAFMWGYATMQIPNGYLAHMWSAQKLFSLGLFLSGIINFCLPLAVQYGGYIALCIGRALIGLCQSCFSSCTFIILSKWAPPNERARMSTFVTTGTILGSVLAMSTASFVASTELGWPGIFHIFGLLGLVSSIVFFIVVYECPSQYENMNPLERKFILDSFQQLENHSDASKTNPPWKRIGMSVPVWALIIVECGSNWGTWAFHTEIPIYIKNVLDFNIEENGIISSLPFLSFWILSIFFSWVSDYATAKNVSISIIRRASNTVGMWGPAFALAILSLVDKEHKTWHIILIILAVGLKSGTACGYIVNQIDLSPNFAGTIYSITTCVGATVSIMAPIVCGEIVQDVTNVKQWHIIFCSTALVYFITNSVYIIFGKGKIRSWNTPNELKIETVYDPKNI